MEEQVLRDCGVWCSKMGMGQVLVEMEDLKEREVMQDIRVQWMKCDRRVNCVAHCLLSKCAGQNIIFRKFEALPKGFTLMLSLEGIPHFSSIPRRDVVPLMMEQFKTWDPGGYT